MNILSNVDLIDSPLNFDQLINNVDLINAIRLSLDDKRVVIIKNAFKTSDLDLIIDSHTQHFSDKQPLSPSSYCDANEDFFRIDNNPTNSTLKKNQTIYFYIYSINDNNIVRRTCKNIGLLRNRIANLEDNFGHFNNKDGYLSIGTVQHYGNNGFMSEHFDPYLPQKVVVSLVLSDNYDKGGFSLNINNSFVNVDRFTSAGDVVIFSAKLEHRVEEIFGAPNKDGSGRWRMTSVLLPKE